MLKRIKFKGGFFTEEADLELFRNEDRMSIVYGKNGTGKSTLANAMRKAKGDSIDDIIEVSLYDQEGSDYTDVQCIHVFNEDYVNSRVKIRDDGLNTIVLFGELGNLEDRILDLQRMLDDEISKNKDYKATVEEFNDKNSEKSPSKCKAQIITELSEDGAWAEREKIINNLKRKASVTDKVVCNIVELKPVDSQPNVKKRYEENLQLLEKVRENETVQIKNTTKLNIPYDEDKLQSLLAQKVERPELSEREKYLLQCIDDGKFQQIAEIKSVFSKESIKLCPFCFRKISEQEKQDLVNSVEKVLSKAVESHKESLEKCVIQDVDIDFSGMDILDSSNYIKCKDIEAEINKEIHAIREIINEKSIHPYTPITNFKCDLNNKLEKYEAARIELQKEIETYNEAAKKIKTLTGSLSDDNCAIAHYEILREIKAWQQALENQKQANEILEKSDEKIKKMRYELSGLKAQKKSIKIAVDLINKSLRYVFFSKDRLEIKVENEKYVLYAHGKAVKPNNVSVGERNIIALCYFFTELIMNQEVKNGYSQKAILVIDDPVSSFDFENKVGIMSLLKVKLADIIKSNPESQILLLTHDIRCAYDFEKIGQEITSEYKKESGGQKKVSYMCQELKGKKFYNFSVKNRNEYSELLKTVYNYACGNNDTANLTIGNSMRRVLEAFSTFTYKKGIEEVSYDEKILQSIEDKDMRDFFKNLMYRLVLNGDSHMQDRTNSLEDMDYLDFLADEERRRTAQEVICFIYLLNKQHILAHLDGEKNVETNIREWHSDIKSLCTDDEVTEN